MELRYELGLVVGPLAIVIWVAMVLAIIRRFKRVLLAEQEKKLQDALNEGGWSDRLVESLLSSHPGSPAVLTQYVNNAADRQDWPEALRRSLIFATRAPGVPQSWLARIRVLQSAGRAEDSLDLLHQAVRRFPRAPEILTIWAQEAMQRQDWTEAVRRLARLRRHSPEDCYGYEAGANALLSAGRPEEAEALVATAIRRQPQEWRMWQAAARLAERQGHDAEAIRRWEALRERFNTVPEGFLSGAAALTKAGHTEAAAALIWKALSLFPSNNEVVAAAAKLTAAPTQGS